MGAEPLLPASGQCPAISRLRGARAQRLAAQHEMQQDGEDHDDRAADENQVQPALERRPHVGEQRLQQRRPPGTRANAASICGRTCTSSSGFAKYGSAAAGTCAGIACAKAVW